MQIKIAIQQHPVIILKTVNKSNILVYTRIGEEDSTGRLKLNWFLHIFYF